MQKSKSSLWSLTTHDPSEINVIVSGVDPQSDYYKAVAALTRREVKDPYCAGMPGSLDAALWRQIHHEESGPDYLEIGPNLYHIATAACQNVIDHAPRFRARERKQLARAILAQVIDLQSEHEAMLVNSTHLEFSDLSIEQIRHMGQVEEELIRLQLDTKNNQ